MAKPKYRRIADSLRQKIDERALKAGDQLPTEADLARDWNTSRTTVRDAISRLTELGLVEARAGQGTFVAEKIAPFVTDLSAGTASVANNKGDLYFTEVTERGRTPKSTEPTVEMHLAGGAIAAAIPSALQLAPGSQIVSRHQRRFIDDRPYSLQTSFYPESLVARGAQRLAVPADIPEGTTQYIRDKLGIEQVGYRDIITVRTPDADETEFFGLPEDGRVAVFVHFRTSYAQDGNPIRVSVTVYPADRNEFVIHVETPNTEQADDEHPG